MRWCAEHRYPYIGLGTELGPTCDLWDIYAEEAAKHGYQAGTENFGYLLPTVVAETDEKAHEVAQQLHLRRRAERLRARPNTRCRRATTARPPSACWPSSRPEAGSASAAPTWKAWAPTRTHDAEIDYKEVKAKLDSGLKRIEGRLQLIAGTPKTVLEKIKVVLQRAASGHLHHVQRPGAGEQRAADGQHAAVCPGGDARDCASTARNSACSTRSSGRRARSSWRMVRRAAPVNNREPLYEQGLYKRPESARRPEP